jgi:hypothetical protein
MTHSNLSLTINTVKCHLLEGIRLDDPFDQRNDWTLDPSNSTSRIRCDSDLSPDFYIGFDAYGDSDLLFT